jgi:hypothetical protein
MLSRGSEDRGFAVNHNSIFVRLYRMPPGELGTETTWIACCRAASSSCVQIQTYHASQALNADYRTRHLGSSSSDFVPGALPPLQAPDHGNSFLSPAGIRFAIHYSSETNPGDKIKSSSGKKKRHKPEDSLNPDAGESRSLLPPSYEAAS